MRHEPIANNSNSLEQSLEKASSLVRASGVGAAPAQATKRYEEAEEAEEAVVEEAAAEAEEAAAEAEEAAAEELAGSSAA